MNRADRRLRHLLSLARRAGADETQAGAAEEAGPFAHRVAAAWGRELHRPPAVDELRLWERVGAWALAVGTALVFLTLVFHPREAMPDPFGPLGADDSELVWLF